MPLVKGSKASSDKGLGKVMKGKAKEAKPKKAANKKAMKKGKK